MRASERAAFAAQTYPGADPKFPGSAGALSAPNIAAAEVLSFQPVDGTWVWVESVRSWFYYASNPGLAVDGITVINAYTGGTSRLIRSTLNDPTWAKVANWGINATTGNDENVGSPASPLKTAAELFRRINGQLITQNTLTRIQSSLPSSDPIEGHIRLKGDVSFGFEGDVASVLYTGSVTALTALNRATNTAYLVSDAAIPDFAPFVGQRLRIVGGANNNVKAFIAWRNPASGVQARLFRPALVPNNPNTPPFGSLVLGAVALNDVFQIESLFTIFLGDVVIDANGFNALDTGLGFADLNIRSAAGGFGTVADQSGGAVTNFFDCRFEDPCIMQLSKRMSFIGCMFASGIQIYGGTRYFVGGGALPFFGSTNPGLTQAGPSYVSIDADFFTQGCSITTACGTLDLGFVAAFDAGAEAGNQYGAGINVGSTAPPAANFSRAGAGAASRTGAYLGNALYGSGNLVGLAVGAMCGFTYETLANLTIAGSGADAAWRLGTSANSVQAIDAAGAAIGPTTETWANLAAARPGGFGGFASNPENLATIAPGA